MRKLLILATILTSCSRIDCERFANMFRAKECNIIVKDTPSPGRRFKIQGINANTHEKATYLDQDAWYLHFNHKIEVGDTVVKRHGELKMYIHKKDTVLAYIYQCEGKIYD